MGDKQASAFLELSPLQEELVLQFAEVYPEGLSMNGLVDYVHRARSAIHANIHELCNRDILVAIKDAHRTGRRPIGRPTIVFALNDTKLADVITYFEIKCDRIDDAIANLDPHKS